MAGISLEGSIRTCKVDTAYASKVQSDRFLNPGNMVCPIWNGFDSAGRRACPESFNTKSAGCNSALDRVWVENYLRPKYVEYVNLSESGIDGQFYGSGPCAAKNNTMTQWNTSKAISDLDATRCITGNFGTQFGSVVYPNCGVGQYAKAMAQDADTLRKYSALDLTALSNCRRSYSGMW